MNNTIPNLFSQFWLDDKDQYLIDDLLGVDVEIKKGKDLVELAGYKRAISNFVNIITGKSIPVRFNSKNESYTSGDKIVIGANLNDKNFDIAVGLALHEGSHVLLSDFELLQDLDSKIPQELCNKAFGKGYEKNNALSHIKTILNYIEDRRIDHFIFSTSPGYKGYYHSMYDKHFYSKVIDKALMSAEYRTEKWNSYEFRLINLHNNKRQLNALKGLKDIWKSIDLKNISRLESSADVLETALTVYSIILDNISDGTQKVDKDTGEISTKPADMNDRDGGDDIDIQSENDQAGNDDSSSVESNNNSDLPGLSDRQKTLLDKAINKQKDFLNGDVRKTKLNKSEANTLKALEESGATYKDVGQNVCYNGEKTRCLVVNTLTRKLIDSGVFGCADKWRMERYDHDSPYSRYDFVEEGLRLGNILGRKLKIRSEERSTKYTRKDSGKIDKRMLSELGFGNTNIFSQTLTDRYNKAYLHISIDASGSMCGEKWNKAMTSAVAMIKACSMAGNIEVVVSIRTTHDGSGQYSNVPLIMVIYDSRTDNLTKVKTLFKALGTTGTTPEGLCFEAIVKDLVPGNGKQDSYFINYSDGHPSFHSKNFYYRGSDAEKHTRKQVNKMKNAGIKVLSYFISEEYESDHSSFRAMYGKDAQFINATSMMEVARTMNKKFLEK
jgi:ribosome biogenesis protein Nip4